MRPSKDSEPRSEKQRKSDEEVRDLLRTADLKKLDRALEKALDPSIQKPEPLKPH
jgi:hypothetical protein